MNEPIVRAEREEDAAAIRAVVLEAFGGPAEADLVEALRAADALTISLVATVDDGIVGHVAFSPMELESKGETIAAIGLAPVAVLPSHQQRGIAAAMIEAGLAQARQGGHRIAFVLGSPAYYPRFGFTPAHLFGVRWEKDSPPDSFMLLPLTRGGATGVSGVARYHTAFNNV